MIIELHELQDLQHFLKRFPHGPVILFKHSTQCSRSAAVKEEFDSFHQSNPTLPCGLVLVIESRKVSNEIEERFDIIHESPQAILLKDGAAVWHASHWAVTEESLEDALTESANHNS
jgi:bacillithiol system protein YtxJ